MRPLTRRAKVLLCLVAASLLLAGLVSYQSLRLLRARSAAVGHTLEVLNAGQSLSVSILRAESGERGYLLTGNPAMLEAYRRGAQSYRERFALLRQLTRDNPLQQSRLDALGPLIEARMRQLALGIDASARGDVQGVRAALVQESADTDEELRARILEIQDTERTLLDERTGSVTVAYRLGIVFTIASAVLIAVLFVLVVANSRRDLLVHQRLERSVAEQGKRLRIALESADMGIHVWDIQSNRVEWDARVRALWSVGRDEPIDYALFFAGLHPEDRAPIQAAIAAALDPDGARAFAADYRVVGRDDGRVRWVHSTGRVFFDGRRPLHLIGTVREITDAKLAEQALRDADRRKDEFLATLAHELRNPLGPIRNAATLLRAGLIERRSWAIQIIDRQVQTMSRLLDDLLDVARITRGKLTLHPRRVRLATLIHRALETAHSSIEAKHHSVSVSVPADLELDADPVRLEQVFSNLLTNAAKYMNRGGHIEVRTRVEDDTVSVTVSDQGIGLDAQSLPGLFRIFAQGHTALDRAEGGLGIGLALVKATVELHGGTVTAHSEGPGKGSAFVVRLPLQDAMCPVAAPPEPQAAAISSKRVLVADDNRDGAETLALLLELAGHDVEVVYSGRAALDACARRLPDVAIVDIGMPDMNGYDVARAICAREDAAAIRLIALTGWGQESDRQRALEAGFDAHLTKPVDSQALEKLIGGESTSEPGISAANS